MTASTPESMGRQFSQVIPVTPAPFLAYNYMLAVAIVATLGGEPLLRPRRRKRSGHCTGRQEERRGVVLLGRVPRVSDLAFSSLFSKLAFLICSSACFYLFFLCSKRKSVYERTSSTLGLAGDHVWFQLVVLVRKIHFFRTSYTTWVPQNDIFK